MCLDSAKPGLRLGVALAVVGRKPSLEGKQTFYIYTFFNKNKDLWKHQRITKLLLTSEKLVNKKPTITYFN